MRPESRQLLWLILFSIAMGFLEAAVVIYLRYLYYPDGFNFPLAMMEERVVITELLREAATVIMLVGIGVLAGRTKPQRLAFFLISFAVWDIFYYVFLKLILGWPASLLTWDILFLIPIPWIGPVLTPCIASLTMILLAGVIYYRDMQQVPAGIKGLEWAVLIGGSLVVLLSWTWDYFKIDGFISAEKSALYFSTYQPQSFNWWLFGLGESLLLAAIVIYFKRTSVKRTVGVQ